MQILSGVNSSARTSVAGYFGGGNDSGGRISGIDRYAFPADTKTTLTATLTTATSSIEGMANSGVAGYFMGGYAPSATAVVDKLSFATETIATTTQLSGARVDVAGFANSGVAGYSAGGFDADVDLLA